MVLGCLLYADVFSELSRWLFLRFFIRSYTTRISRSTTRQQKPVTSRGRAVLEASEDAARSTDREIEEMSDRAERTMRDVSAEVKRDLADIQRGLKNSSAKRRIETLEEQTKEFSESTMESLRQRLSQVTPHGSVEDKVKKVEEFISGLVAKGEGKFLANGGGKDEVPREASKVDNSEEKQSEKTDEGESQKARSTSEESGENGTDHNSSSKPSKEEFGIKEDDTPIADTQPDQHHPSDGQVDGSDKENEEPREPQTNGDTQPGSMGTSQTVSDLDGSYADVPKGDADATKVAENEDSGSS